MRIWIINNAWHDWMYGQTFDFVSNLADMWLDIFWDNNPSFVLIWLDFLNRKLFDNFDWDFKWFCVPSQILCNFFTRIQEVSIKLALPKNLYTWLPKFILIPNYPILAFKYQWIVAAKDRDHMQTTKHQFLEIWVSIVSFIIS